MNGSDVRDERLGDALEGVVRNLQPRPALDRVMRRGSRRRLVQLAAAYVTVAVFVAGAAWAGAVIRAGRTTSAGSIVGFSSNETPWIFEYPAGWDVATGDFADPDRIVDTLRTTVASEPLPEGIAAFGPNSGSGDELVASLGGDGAAVIVRRVWTSAEPLDCDEWGPRAFADDASNPGWEFRERHRSDGTLCFAVLEWLGPEASAQDRAAAAAIAGSVRLAEIERWTESDGDRITLPRRGRLVHGDLSGRLDRVRRPDQHLGELAVGDPRARDLPAAAGWRGRRRLPAAQPRGRGPRPERPLDLGERGRRGWGVRRPGPRVPNHPSPAGGTTGAGCARSRAATRRGCRSPGSTRGGSGSGMRGGASTSSSGWASRSTETPPRPRWRGRSWTRSDSSRPEPARGAVDFPI